MEFICFMLGIISLILFYNNLTVVSLIIGAINILMVISIIKIKEERGNKFLSIITIIISLVSVILGMSKLI